MQIFKFCFWYFNNHKKYRIWLSYFSIKENMDNISENGNSHWNSLDGLKNTAGPK